MGEIDKRTEQLSVRSEKFTAKEIATYSVASIVVTALLLFSGFPLAFLFFLASASYLVWRLIAPAKTSTARSIFEFYLLADEIISNPRRRWYGFEVEEVIVRGEEIVRRCDPPPPLALYALGCLYKISGDHERAGVFLNMLSDESYDEIAIKDPSSELREYVALRRRIERAPEESPKVSRAIRRLERSRMLRLEGVMSELTAHSRQAEVGSGLPPGESRGRDILKTVFNERLDTSGVDRFRPPISEVLHSVYDVPGEKDN
ncbi:MAG: hypothetical protein IPM50_01560 [Acidobacteriota bacterium]|nr:MAG: hypothetical protein IPM50_01560 [Acidobacteriota bacterium]